MKVFQCLIKNMLCAALFFSIISIELNTMSITAGAQLIMNHSLDLSKNTDSYEVCCSNDDNIYVTMENDKTHFSTNENIVVSYIVSSNDIISDFDYIQEGFVVSSVRIDAIDKNRIIMELSCLQNAFEHSLNMQITMSNGDRVIAMLYAVQNEHGCFISPFSKDDAMQKYFDYAREHNFMTQQEYEIAKAEMNQNYNVEREIVDTTTINMADSSAPLLASDEICVSGTLRWIDDLGNYHPLRGIMVKIYDKELSSSICLATTYTDNQGNYMYSFKYSDEVGSSENGCNDIFIRAFAGTNNAMVQNSGGENYYYETSVSYNVPTDMTVIKQFTINMEGDLGRAFQISQAIITARDYSQVMMGRTPNNVTVRYPYDNSCYYSRSENCITITGNAPSEATYPNSYASWDTIMHEYGHHIQKQLGHSNSPGGRHVSSQNDADELNDKDAGIRLAWGESWPTVFGLLAQDYYDTFLANILTVGDTCYTAYNGNDYDIDSVAYCLGDACERSIMAVLWDLYDDSNETYDRISLGHKSFWDISTNGQNKTFSDFIQKFYETYPDLTDEIGKNLSYYKMATTKPIMTNASLVSQETPPTFSWQAQGGSTNFPNNRFQLIFYDISGSEVLRTTPTTNTTYTLSQSEWESLLYSFGTTYSVSVSAWQTSDPITGGYISEKSSAYRKPTPENLTQSFTVYNSTNYTEKIVDLQPGQYIDYYVTFRRSATRTVQTFGMKDTILELYSADGTLLLGEMDTDDNGYESNAFFKYYFQANTVYKIRVMFYSSEEAGTVKMGIMPVTGFETYYDISNRKDNTTGVTGSFTRYYSRAFTFEYTETNTYTFTLTAQADAYLYIIDPRSTKPTGDAWLSLPTEDSIYNDDYEDGTDSRITKLFDANVPYLVIITTYDPSLETSVGTFDLDIE